jgi:hypothetical protein
MRVVCHLRSRAVWLATRPEILNTDTDTKLNECLLRASAMFVHYRYDER